MESVGVSNWSPLFVLVVAVLSISRFEPAEEEEEEEEEEKDEEDEEVEVAGRTRRMGGGGGRRRRCGPAHSSRCNQSPPLKTFWPDLIGIYQTIFFCSLS